MAQRKWRPQVEKTPGYDAWKPRNGNGPYQNTLKQEQPTTAENGRYKDFVTATAREMAERKWRLQVEETGYNAGKLQIGKQPVPQGWTVIEIFGPDTSGIAGYAEPKTGSARAEKLASVTARSGKESSGTSELPSRVIGEGPGQEHEPARQEIPTKVEGRESSGGPNGFFPMTDSQKNLLVNTPLFRRLCAAGGWFRTLFLSQPWHKEISVPGLYSLWTLDGKAYYVGKSDCNMIARLSAAFEKARQNQVETRSYVVPFTQRDLPFMDLYERCAIQQLKPQANVMTYWNDDEVPWFWRTVAEKVVAEHSAFGPIAGELSRKLEPPCEPWETLFTILKFLNTQVTSLPPALEERTALRQQKEREKQKQARRIAEQEAERQKVAEESAKWRAHQDLRQKIMTRVWLKGLGIWYAICFAFLLIMTIRSPANVQLENFVTLPFTSLLLAGMGLIIAGPFIHGIAEAIADELAGKDFNPRTQK